MIVLFSRQPRKIFYEGFKTNTKATPNGTAELAEITASIQSKNYIL